jgi:hypothetical protein
MDDDFRWEPLKDFTMADLHDLIQSLACWGDEANANDMIWKAIERKQHENYQKGGCKCSP